MTKTPATSETPTCSFCLRPKHEVDALVAGDQCNICNECVEQASEFLAEHRKNTLGMTTATEEVNKEILTPSEIKKFLDDYVIGQDKAKIILAVAVYNHYKRINNAVVDDVELRKTNVLMLGPTGSGKTLLAETVSKCLGVPFVIADCTSLTETGYTGEDVDSILTRLLAAADGNTALASRGIVFLDEVDKIRSRGGNNRDVSGEGVQQALLKMLDGADISVTPPGGRRGMSETITMNTRDILFVVSGAFVGLSKIIEKDTNGGPKIGFGAVPVSSGTISDQRVKAEHLIKFGLIPEFVGRLPVIAVLDELNEQQLVHVLTEPKNAIVKQYRALFKLDKVEFDISHEALLSIAKLAIKQKTGARGLMGVMEDKLTDCQYHLPDYSKAGAHKVHVGADVFDGDGVPIVLYNV